MFHAHPESLHSLSAENTPLAKYFLGNIRPFNSGMAMTSVKVPEKIVLRHGPTLFKVSGQMYQMISPMLQQKESASPAFMQTYFHNPEYQVSHHANINASSNISANDMNGPVSIFHTLHRSIANDCQNSCLQYFFSINVSKERGLMQRRFTFN